MPLHPSLFRFLNCVQTSVIGNGFAIVAQTNSGRTRRTKLASAQKHLLEAAVDVERRYHEGELSASDVLRIAAAHFDDNKVAEAFVAFARSQEETELVAQPADDDLDTDDEEGVEEDGLLPDVDVTTAIDDLEVDDRLLELERDPDLTDVDPEVWMTTVWPIITGNAGKKQEKTLFSTPVK